MRAAAEVEPVALRVDLQILVLGDGVDQFDLVGLALVAKHLLGLVARPDLLGERPVAADDLAHLLLDDRKILRRERLVAREIVVEPVLDHRADRHLRSRPQFLHGFGQHMRGVVADEFQRARIVAGDDLDLAGLAERIGEVADGRRRAHRRPPSWRATWRSIRQAQRRSSPRRSCGRNHREMSGKRSDILFSYPVPQTSAGGDVSPIIGRGVLLAGLPEVKGGAIPVMSGTRRTLDYSTNTLTA